MADWGLIAIRFALYADLMLLVGLSAFPLYSFTRAEREARNVLPLGTILAWLAVGGLLFSVSGFAIASAAMMGVPLADLDVPMLVSMANESALGMAWAIRLAALGAVLAGLLLVRRNESTRLALSCAGGTVALSTMLWSGHAGATEGALGTAHRISDIAHMVAAAIWIGGIAAFAALLRPRAETYSANVIVVACALAGFSRVGTAAVAIIVLTGILNSFAILGEDMLSMFKSIYGLLLASKVALFGAMLILAANNRWKLTPAFERSVASESPKAWSHLRISVGLEAAAGACVLILVAWLGTLSPEG